MTQRRLFTVKVVAEMKRIHSDKKLRVYGSPRMVEELWALGYQISENTVARLMREHGLVAKGFKPWNPPQTTTPDPHARYSQNHLKTPLRINLERHSLPTSPTFPPKRDDSPCRS